MLTKKIGIIGRSEWLYNTLLLLLNEGYDIAFVVTSKEAPEYKYSSRDFEALAHKWNIPFLHDPKIDRPKLRALMGDDLVDICISI